MTSLRIDPGGSRVTLRTRASGLLSKLAHDLEIAADGFEGTVERAGERWSARLVFPVERLRVVGVCRGDRVDERVLSAGDRAEIERKIRSEVFAARKELTVEARGDTLARGDAEIDAGRGLHSVPLRLGSRDDGAEVSGETRVSMKRLGLAPVKGPLGAFKVDDTVEVNFRVRLAPGL